MDNINYQYNSYPDFLNRKIIDGFRKLIKDTKKIIEYYQKYNYNNEAEQLKFKLSIFHKAYVVIKNYRSEIYDGKQLNGIKGISPGIPERINLILEHDNTNDFKVEELAIAYQECPDMDTNKDINDDVYLFVDMDYDSSRNASPTSPSFNTSSNSSSYLNSFKSVSSSVIEGVKNNIPNPLHVFKRISVSNFVGGYLEDEDYHTSYTPVNESYIDIPPHQIV